MKHKHYIYLIILVFLAGCKPNIEEFTASKGNADFTKYIAIGNSLTAGYADGALYKSGQEYSYPNILATQFKFVGGGDFKQPLMLDDLGVGFSGLTPVTKRILGFPADCLGNTSMAPVFASDQIDPANLASIADQGPFNNYGIPGMKTIHIAIPSYAALNPYYGRFAQNMAATVAEEITQLNATFFTYWLGSNDVLGYAIGGGEGEVITPLNLFKDAVSGGLDAAMANGAKGAIANVPAILDIPYFNTIPYNPIVITEQSQLEQLNSAYAALNQLIISSGSTDTIHFELGQNPMVIEDESLAWGMRQIKPTELVLLSLPQDSLKCGGWGTQKAVGSEFVLDDTEQFAINETITQYNEYIFEQAVDRELAFVDAYGILKKALDGSLIFDGNVFSDEFVTGNLYSLDGIHMTPAGAAIAAYYFIMAINATYDAKIPQVVIADFPANQFPETVAE